MRGPVLLADGRGQAARKLGLVCLLVVAAAAGTAIVPRGWPLLVIGLGTAAMMVIATRRRPADRAAWSALAGSVAVFALTAYLAAPHPRPAVALPDLLYVAGYALAYYGLWRLIGTRKDRAEMTDVIVLAVGLAVALSLIVGRWAAHAHSNTALVTLYPLADLPILVLAVRLARVRPSQAASLLALGSLGLQVGGMIVVVTGYQNPHAVVNGLWAMFVVSWALAALVASAPEPGTQLAVQAAPVRFALFRIVVLLVPAALLVQSVLDGERTDFVLALACGACGLFVTRRLRDSVRARYDTGRDPVTGLASFTHLRGRTVEALAERRGDAIVAVFLIDIYDFHAVNNALGFTGGNRILTLIGRRLGRELGPGYTVARTSADRFAVLVTAREADLDLDQYARRLLHLIAAPIGRPSRQLHLEACAGYAASILSNTADELLRNADLALRAAKREGSGHWIGFSPDLLSSAAERGRLRADLISAIDHDQFFLEYQQIVDLRDGSIAGFEALVRWLHPELGQLAPERFIPLAEASGQVRELGLWVLRQAVADTVRLSEAAGRFIFVDVNASPRQLFRQDYATEVTTAIARSGLRPEAIVIEITESGLIGGGPAVIAELRRLKDAGVRVAMDDFGTGYSSLAALRELPIDIVKIDKSFVIGLRPGPRLNLVSAILQLAEARSVSVVAEGVETPLTRKLLADLGCPLGQGYLFSPPVRIADAVRQLHRPG